MRLLDLIEETVGEILELCREEEKTGEEVASVAVSVEKGVEKAFEGEKEELVPLQLCHECLLSKKAEEVETCTECGAIVCGDCREEHKCEKAKA